MPRRHVALGDRDEARQARLGGEQVVAVGIETALGDLVPDRQELPRGVEQKTELHRVEELPRQCGERRDAALERSRPCGSTVRRR